MTTNIRIKGTKRQKTSVEFGADNIDNTAPVKKIIDDFCHKNRQVFSLYADTIRQRNTSSRYSQRNFHSTLPGHPLYAFSDDWDGQLCTGYFEDFPYKSTMPKIITPMRNITKFDPLTSYMKMKNDWSIELEKIKQCAVLANSLSKYEVLNEDVVLCPKQFVIMAAHMDSDPDPYFDSSYNWYYAGNGNMLLICYNQVDYLLHSELNHLYLSQFTKDDCSLNLDSTPKFSCDPQDNILETIYLEPNIIALRAKNKVFILKITMSDDNILLEKLKLIESAMPFTSITFDEHHNNILYITALDNKLTIVNLDRMLGRSVKLKTKDIVNNWSTVIGTNRTYYTHLSTDSITIYDKRDNKIVHTWKDVKSISHDAQCNYISVAKLGEGNDSLYFATDHHLFLMDLRHNSNLTPKAVQRWTHGMQCTPTYMSICNFEYNKELICLSSQWCVDMCVVPNHIVESRDGTEINGVTMPYRPPSILNVLNDARHQLLCSDMYNPIDKRLNTAITGNLLTRHNEKFIILMQNSLGDVTYHVLHPEYLDTFLEDDSIQQLHEWSKLYKLPVKDFEVSSIVDISSILKKLKRVPGNYVPKYKLMEPKSKFNEQEIIDTFEKQELDGCLLDVWAVKQNEITQNIEHSSFYNLVNSEGE